MLKQKGKKYIVKRGPPTSSHATVSRPVSNTHDFLGWKHDLACASALPTPPPAPRRSVIKGIETICLYEIIDPTPIFKIAIKTPSYVRIYV